MEALSAGPKLRGGEGGNGPGRRNFRGAISAGPIRINKKKTKKVLFVNIIFN